MRSPTFLLLTLVCSLSVAAAGLVRQGEPAPVSHPGNVDPVLRGRVERVGDGDSARVLLDSGPIEVRLYGIDAPEFSAPRGREAKKALERLIAHREVEIRPLSQDSYERMVAVMFVGKESVNEAMLARGHAWAYRQYLGQTEGDAERYCRLEADARTARRGLWSQPQRQWLPPWVYRLNERLRERGVRGPVVASRDYSAETAADCLAAVAKARRGRRTSVKR